MPKTSLSALLLLTIGSAQAATIGAENCRVVLPAKIEVADESAEWKGPCVNGYAEGGGTLLRFVGKKQIASFEGRMTQGMMAEGYEKTPNGGQYEGHYQDGLRDGKGSSLTKDGVRYDGEWHAGRREGYGVVNYPLGGRYEGQWRDDHPSDGDGKITYAGGQRTVAARDYIPPEAVDEAKKFALRSKIGDSIERFPQNVAYGNTVPFDKGYAQMTPQQQQQFRRNYPFLHPDDVPPYPEKGTAEIFQWLSKAQTSVRAEGDFRAIIEVDTNGKASTMTIYASPDEQLTEVVKILLFNQKFSPAQCDGKPCAMRFPFNVHFGS